ncbi:MAG: glutaredoxin [Cryobacterium sp.]|nr:glutaredoxin [Oligoflexia bacterium]
MVIIRKIVSFFILAFDGFTSPSPMERTPEAQERVDAQTASLTLYQLPGCPFCVKVRREIRRRGLNIALKNIGTDSVANEELITGGGMRQVPCLKIPASTGTQWMYESSDINEYLRKIG